MKMKIKNTKGERAGMSNFNKVKFDRKKLYDEIWKLSAAGVAKKYNLHYAKLITSLKENHIPYPPSGYWTRLAYGKDVSKEIVPLPESEIEEIYLYLASYTSIKKNNEQKVNNVEAVEPNKESKSIKNIKGITLPDNILPFLDEEERKAIIIALADVHVKLNSKLHPVLVAYKKSIEEWKQREKESRYIRRNYYDYKRGETIEQPAFMNEVSTAGLSRVIAILNAVYKIVEMLGGKINSDLSMKIREDVVKISFAEGQDKKTHELTKQEAKELLEYKENIKFKEYASKPQIKKYDYFYNGKMRIKFENSSYIRDNEQQKLEDRLDDIIIELYGISEEHRILREKREEEHQRYLEEKRQAEQRAERIEEEKQNTQALVNKAKDYQIACEIRNYINAVSGGMDILKETKQWVEWAKEKADWFDPVIAKEDKYLGVRNHSLSEDEKRLTKERRDRFYY
ncbi:hypothetical protein [[Clostridium] hylemonae]|uniref:hypothetical protein n=2 Tax=[Clostridium] hylemonae TaxID=89153 RepID=UPI001D070659|nr:hypothetical protein [[Clostridium] hylemonae]